MCKQQDKCLAYLLSTVVIKPYARKCDEDIEDIDEDVYCSIAVTKCMLYTVNPDK